MADPIGETGAAALAPRPHVRVIPSCPHGSLSEAERQARGLDGREVIDFSASTNPLGPPSGVAAALARVAIGRYPDDGAPSLRAALAERDGCPIDQISVGNGSSELIWLLALAYLAPGDPVLILGPTFGEYARATQVVGAVPRMLRAAAADDFQPPLGDLARAAAETLPRLVFLCNPNNPTGTLLNAAQISAVLAACPTALVVVDEAYRAFCADPPDLTPLVGEAAGGSRLVLLRSLTKDCGLAGLRLGYLRAAPPVVVALDRVRPPWNVSAAAEAAGRAALADPGHLARAQAAVAEARTYLMAALSDLGLRVYPPTANFLLVSVASALPDDEPSPAAGLRERLLRRGLCIRDCTSFGLPDCVRIGIRTKPECEQLVVGLRAELGKPAGAASRRRPGPARAHRARTIMVQGTASSVGKSLVVAGLCRWFHQEGIRVAPFKAQNMALNSAVTPDGREIGRSTAVQAAAAGIPPTVAMNPVLLKPEGDSRSQLVVLGRPAGHLQGRDYLERKRALWEVVAASLDRLRADWDLVVIEGAGSPAEVNLRAGDIVNMRVARYAESPVLLVGDIDRGGVFAALVGTLDLLAPEERDLVRGLVINRFRGDPSLLRSGLTFLQERTAKPVLGVLPYLPDLRLPEEDAVGLESRDDRGPSDRPLDVAVLRLPHVANFDDFDLLAAEPAVNLRYVDDASRLGQPDLVVLPGTKSTVADLAYLRGRALAPRVVELARSGTPVLGICGGYQMLGTVIHDPDGVEAAPGAVAGLGLLPVETTFLPVKRTRQVTARGLPGPGWCGALADAALSGYEIHMGVTTSAAAPVFALDDGDASRDDGARSPDGAIVGTYLHGLFENAAARAALIGWLGQRKGRALTADAGLGRDGDLDRLAAWLRASLDGSRLRAIVGV